MRSLSSIPRPVLLGAALVYGATLTLYTVVWLYYAGWSPAVRIGIEWKPEYTPYVTFLTVDPDSPAGRAGLLPQDRILTVNGFRQHVLSVAPAIAHGKAGDVVNFRIQRPGTVEPFDVPVKLEAARPRERLTPVKWLPPPGMFFNPCPRL